MSKDTHTLKVSLSLWDDEGEELQYNSTELIKELGREILARREVAAVSITDVDVSIRDDSERYYSR